MLRIHRLQKALLQHRQRSVDLRQVDVEPRSRGGRRVGGLVHPPPFRVSGWLETPKTNHACSGEHPHENANARNPNPSETVAVSGPEKMVARARRRPPLPFLGTRKSGADKGTVRTCLRTPSGQTGRRCNLDGNCCCHSLKMLNTTQNRRSLSCKAAFVELSESLPGEDDVKNFIKKVLAMLQIELRRWDARSPLGRAFPPVGM